MLGHFEIGKDLLLCNYDGLPDEDDLHSVAGLATMLANERLSGVDYHCTAGAYGKQNFDHFLDEPHLFDLAFGSNWASAEDDWDEAVQTATTKALATLNADGDIWVTDAGQSDFIADVVRRIQSELPAVDTKSRVHLVQHSGWNQNQTTEVDLTYVRENTDYEKVPDGNTGGNGTPGLTILTGDQWGRATADPQVGAVWVEARAAAERGFGIEWDNDRIKGGGMDFSDTVEVMWVFGFTDDSYGVKEFFDEFM